MTARETVEALNTLTIFRPDQSSAFREHYDEAARVLGTDVETRASSYVEQWVASGTPGGCVLTGNAGTGKTAIAEHFCLRVGGVLPKTDELTEVAPGKFIVKDLSGVGSPEERSATLDAALAHMVGGQVLVCANEGVLRDALQDRPDNLTLLDTALRVGAADRNGELLVVNMNRQRLTALSLWDRVLDHLVKEELWQPCHECPHASVGCPLVDNAAMLRKPSVREALRMLVRVASGEAVPTIRELWAILAYSVTGGLTCETVQAATRDKGAAAFANNTACYNLILGDGLTEEALERSPLLMRMRDAGLGDIADLQVDEWVRDSSGGPAEVRELAAAPSGDITAEQDHLVQLGDSKSHLDRVNTGVGTMTFHQLGEMVATSEDVSKVRAGIAALTGGNTPQFSSWRRRVFFEGAAALGGVGNAGRRLLRMRFIPDLLSLAERITAGSSTVSERNELVKGLNFLVTGFPSAVEGLVVPDPGCLFARDPGAYRPARPSFVQGQIAVEELILRVPDRGLVNELLDVDNIEIELVVEGSIEHVLRIGPRMYEAIREAAAYGGPVGQGTAEMADMRSFYGQLAGRFGSGVVLKVAAPDAQPPAFVTVRLPEFVDA